MTDWLIDCSWSSSDDNDDPLEAARDSTFVKILQKLIQEGTVTLLFTHSQFVLRFQSGLGLIWDLLLGDIKYII